MQFTRTGGCILNERNGSKIPMHRRTESTQSSWVKGVTSDKTITPKIKVFGVRCREAVSPGLKTQIAPSHVVPAANASHGTVAGTAAHHADEEGETAMEGARAVPAPLPSQPTAPELEPPSGTHTPYRAWGLAYESEDAVQSTTQVIDDVPVDCAFFGEHDQTAKLVLILREHQCRWTEALPVHNKGRPRRPRSPVRCRHGPTNGTAETHHQVKSTAIDTGFEKQGSC